MKKIDLNNFPVMVLVVALLLLLLCELFIVYFDTLRVDYIVIDADGRESVEVWKRSGSEINYFDEKKNYIGQVKFGIREGQYYEDRMLLGDQVSDKVVTKFLFDKSPEMLAEQETMDGRVTISATGVDHSATLAQVLKRSCVQLMAVLSVSLSLVYLMVR